MDVSCEFDEFILKQCWRFYLDFSVRAVPKNAKAKKSRNAKKAAGKVLREGGLGRRVPGGSAESKAGHCNQAIPTRITCRDISNYVDVFKTWISSCFVIDVNTYRAHFLSPFVLFCRRGNKHVRGIEGEGERGHML